MKRISPLALVLVLAACLPAPAPRSASTPTPADTSQTALDWAGVYQGTLPCADCAGIETTLELRADGHYRLSETYLAKGKPFVTRGTFAWQAGGGAIALDAAASHRRFWLGEGLIWHLDLEGKVISGALAEAYVLRKTR